MSDYIIRFLGIRQRRVLILVAVVVAAGLGPGPCWGEIPDDRLDGGQAELNVLDGFRSDDLERPYAYAVYDDGSGDALYAGGNFVTAGGITVNKVAKWDGAQWSALTGPNGTGVSGGMVDALAVWDDGDGEALYVGGRFTSAGGIAVNHVAKWDGRFWSALSGPSGIGADDWVTELVVYDDGGGEALYAGGLLHNAGGVFVDHIAKWDGTQWSALSGPFGTGADNWVHALAVYDDGSGEALYVGGQFETAGGVAVNYVAKWASNQWSALYGPSDTGVIDYVWELAVFDDGNGEALYVGGFFLFAGGIPSLGISKWDGTQWSNLYGSSDFGLNGAAMALTVYDDGSGDALYAGGMFTTAGDVTATNIARWDGTSWSALSGPSGNGVNDNIYATGMYDDGCGAALYAGGEFTTAGGIPAPYIAKWDGTEWSAITACTGEVFSDGFESSDTSSWSATVP